MKPLFAGLMLVAAGVARADDLQFVSADGPIAVRFNVPGLDERHRTFVETLFAFLDRDGNKSLDAKEAGHLFQLPLSDTSRKQPTFATLDADGDGKVTAIEFADQLRRTGYESMQCRAQSAPGRAGEIDAVLLDKLDKNRDGELDRAELLKAADLLKSFDLNGDESLQAEEIRPGRQVLPKGMSIEWKKADSPTATAEIKWKNNQPTIELTAGRMKADGPNRIRFAEGVLRVVADEMHEIDREFYLAPFRQALGNATSLQLKKLADDPMLGFLEPLANLADRNGDGRLSLNEIETTLDLLDIGYLAQVSLVAIDHGRPLFVTLDTNGDGKLDLRELNRAAEVLLTDRRKSIRPDQLPRRIDLSVAEGVLASSFGPVEISAKKISPADTPKAKREGPAWFIAQDSNHDGLISPAEFVGPPAVFKTLDRDGDGVISPAEAQRQ